MTLIHSMSAALLAFHAPITPIVPRNIHATMLLRPDAIWRGAAIGAVGASVVRNVLDRKSLKTSTEREAELEALCEELDYCAQGALQELEALKAERAEAEKVIQEALAAKEKEAAKLAKELGEVNGSLTKAESGKKDLGGELKSLYARASAAEKEAETAKAALEAAKEAEEAALKAKAAAEAEVQRKVEELASTVPVMEELKSSAETYQSQANAMVAEVQMQAESEGNKVKELRDKIDRLEGRVAEAKEAKTKAEKELRGEQKKATKAEELQVKAEDEAEDLRAEVASLRVEAATAAAASAASTAVQTVVESWVARPPPSSPPPPAAPDSWKANVLALFTAERRKAAEGLQEVEGSYRAYEVEEATALITECYDKGLYASAEWMESVKEIALLEGRLSALQAGLEEEDDEDDEEESGGGGGGGWFGGAFEQARKKSYAQEKRKQEERDASNKLRRMRGDLEIRQSVAAKESVEFEVLRQEYRASKQQASRGGGGGGLFGRGGGGSVNALPSKEEVSRAQGEVAAWDASIALVKGVAGGGGGGGGGAALVDAEEGCDISEVEMEVREAYDALKKKAGAFEALPKEARARMVREACGEA